MSRGKLESVLVCFGGVYFLHDRENWVIVWSPKAVGGSKFSDLSLCLTHIDSSSLQLTWSWVNQAHWERPHQSVSTVLQAAQMWEYIPNKPRHFNKPWLTRMIESFNRVKYEVPPQLVQGGRNLFLPEIPPCIQIHKMRPKDGAHSFSCPLHPGGA